MDKASIDTILAPVSDESACGNDLEYDPAFTALEACARSKAEQQFGDSIIPAVEPDWRLVSTQAVELMQRSKDVRVAVLAVRASTRMQGIQGFVQGIQTLRELLARYWQDIHPQLDASDNNDPTMRLNALAPLTDSDMLLQDLHEAKIGAARGAASLSVRDMEVAAGKLSARDGDTALTAAQVQGLLGDILTADPALKDICCTAADVVSQLQNMINERVGGDFAVDFKALRDVAAVVQHAAKSLDGTTSDDSGEQLASDAQSGNPGGNANRSVMGQLASRQDAIQTLDKVIRYLEQTEPGNPAPLLIKRAQRLIGVSFIDIMSDLAPDALGTIENITGRPP